MVDIKEQIVGAIMLFIVEEREKVGLPFDAPCFNFGIKSDSYVQFKELYALSDKVLTIALNSSMARKFLQHTELGDEEFSSIALTRDGYAYAMSYKNESAFQIEAEIDHFLTFLKQKLEGYGRTVEQHNFEFSQGDNDYDEYRQKYLLKNQDCDSVINTCSTRKYIKKPFMTRRPCFRLTTAGFARATSVEKDKNNLQKETPMTQIGSVNIHGFAQVGNGNTQNISVVFDLLKAQIEASDAPQEEKSTALAYLKQLMEHPLVCSIIGGVVGGISGGMK